MSRLNNAFEKYGEDIITALVNDPTADQIEGLKDIVKGVFGENADSTLFPALIQSDEILLSNIVKKTMVEQGLSNHKPFEDKIVQLYQVSQINQGQNF